MIRAGESGGILEGVLRHLEEYLERSINLTEDLKSALTYPALLAVVASLSLLVLFVYVIPKFSLIFQDVNQALPWMTLALINFSDGLTRYGWVLLLMIFAGIVAAALYIRNPEGRLQWDHWRLKIWLLGDLFCKLEVARFSATLAALLKGGVSLLEALGTVQGVVGNRVLVRAIGEIQKQVKEGKGMVGPLTESGLFPELALHMIAVGEETGKLEAMLVSVAENYDQEVKRTTKRLMLLIEPALILGMGLIVGVVVISMLMAIFSINDLPF
jgi:general secretion pathway protein F